jgi:hypothetical protein
MPGASPVRGCESALDIGGRAAAAPAAINSLQLPKLCMQLRLRGGMGHTAHNVAAARRPPPNYQEDNFVSGRISRAYNRTVQLDTAD